MSTRPTKRQNKEVMEVQNFTDTAMLSNCLVIAIVVVLVQWLSTNKMSMWRGICKLWTRHPMTGVPYVLFLRYVVLHLKQVANPMGERTGSYSYVSPEGEVVEVGWSCFWLLDLLSQVHYTAGTDGYVILNQDELPQELPFSVCNQSPPDIQVNMSKQRFPRNIPIRLSFHIMILVGLSTNHLLSKLFAPTSLAAMSPGVFVTQVISIFQYQHWIKEGFNPIF